MATIVYEFSYNIQDLPLGYIGDNCKSDYLT
jgi:hypothetical protein